MKKIMCLFSAIFLMSTMTIITHAEHFQGSEGWKVEFLGEKMVSNFESQQIQEEIYDIQPGDSVIFEVKLDNKSDFVTDWYMTNEVLRTLEESNNCAEGGAYTYILTYVDPDGKDNILYTSELVGGEKESIVEGEGLHEATNNLEEFFYLDRLKAGEGGYISLYVMLDGETQGNDYQDTLARLQVNFAVEKVLTDPIINHITVTETKVITRVVNDVVKTGDESPIILFSVLTFACAVVLFILAKISIKRSRLEKGEQR